jgi:hypothetical protein
VSLQIKVDAHEVTEALDQLDKRTSRSALQKATSAAGKYLKPRVRAEAAKVSSRMARATQAVKARRGTPASIVKFSKVAWFAHFVIGGTRGHSTAPRRGSGVQTFTDAGTQKFSRGHQVRGVRPNPIIARVAERDGGRALDVAEEEIVKVLKLD